MSVLKRIWIVFLVLWISLAFGCSSKEIRIETGELYEEISEIEMETETKTKLEKVDSKALIYVYVCGQVQMPGVYALSEGDRIFQAIDQAGGILPSGDAAWLNLAETLRDGQKIYVPSYEEAEAWQENETGSHGQMESKESAADLDSTVNINKASKDELMTLPGIGESKADAIMGYREEQGAFDSIEELMSVPGIKEGTYSKIKDRISIN